MARQVGPIKTACRPNLTAPIHPCAHQQRWRAEFQPRPSRLSTMSTGLQSDRTDTGWLVIFRSDGTVESIQATWTSYEAEALSQADEFYT
ncbi:hypothetical protein ACFX13_008880 [Malus domestica]